MNILEYLNSGVLELYAAGGLTEAERAEVDSMAAGFPEVKAALEEALRSMEAYALTHAQNPPAHLEEQILSQIQSLSNTGAVNGNEAKVLPFTQPPARNTKTPLNQRLQWAAAALLVVSAFTNFYLYRQLKEKDQELLSTRQSVRQYVMQVNSLEQEAFQTENTLAVLRDPQTKAVQLKSVAPNATEALAKVYWNAETKEVFLDKGALPPAPTGKQYQLWALADGKPIDAGVVGEGANPFLKMKTIQAAQAFAVTLEPAGGSVNPTLDAMMAMGSI